MSQVGQEWGLRDYSRYKGLGRSFEIDSQTFVEVGDPALILVSQELILPLIQDIDPDDTSINTFPYFDPVRSIRNHFIHTPTANLLDNLYTLEEISRALDTFGLQGMGFKDLPDRSNRKDGEYINFLYTVRDHYIDTLKILHTTLASIGGLDSAVRLTPGGESMIATITSNMEGMRSQVMLLIHKVDSEVRGLHIRATAEAKAAVNSLTLPTET